MPTAPRKAIRVKTASGWQDMAIVGPQGPKGDAGDAGDPGPGGTIEYYAQPSEPATDNNGAIWIDTDEAPPVFGSGSGMGAVVYTKATRPVADSVDPGSLAIISDELPIRRLQMSDGTSWFLISVNYAPGQTKTIDLVFSSFGDPNGLFYYLGSVGTGTWVVPVPLGNDMPAVGANLTISADAPIRTDYPAYLSKMVDRENNLSYLTGSSTPGHWVKFDLGTRSINPNYVTIRSRSEDGLYVMRNWRVDGSNDDIAWTTLLTVVNDGPETIAGAWFGKAIVGAPDFYRYIRIYMTGPESQGSYFMSIGEAEFYGILRDTT